MKTVRAKDSGIRLITHQSSCEFSAAVTQRRERGDKPEGVGICQAVLTAPFLSFPVPSASLSLLLSLTQSALSSPTAAGCFLGKAERRKISLSLSLSFTRSALFFTPHSLFLSLSTALLCSLSLSSSLFLHIFPLSYFLCSMYLSVRVCVCSYKWFYSLPQTKPDMHKNKNLI